jgi:YbbR domain-containing protein
MASDYYKLAGTGSNRHTDWTAEVVLEVDKDGNPTKVARAGEPVQLTVDDRSKLKELGFEVEQSSKSEADEVEASSVGSDVTGQSPVFGTSASSASFDQDATQSKNK